MYANTLDIVKICVKCVLNRIFGRFHERSAFIPSISKSTIKSSIFSSLLFVVIAIQCFTGIIIKINKLDTTSILRKLKNK